MLLLCLAGDRLHASFALIVHVVAFVSKAALTSVDPPLAVDGTALLEQFLRWWRRLLAVLVLAITFLTTLPITLGIAFGTSSAIS